MMMASAFRSLISFIRRFTLKVVKPKSPRHATNIVKKVNTIVTALNFRSDL